MKKTLLFMSTVIFFFLSAEENYNISINAPNSSNTATFTISSNGELIGRGIRSSCCCCHCIPPYTYKLMDLNGELLAKGSTSLFSPGILLNGSTYISVYDTDGDYLGCISGTQFTWARGKFRFYDANNLLTATAYQDKNSFKFALVDDQAQDLIKIADMQGTSMGSTGHLDVALKEDQLYFDKRILDIFNLFILDFRANCAESSTPVIIPQY